MSGKWTPGPWRADLGETYRVRSPQNRSIAWATFVFSSGRREIEEVAANAHLMSASPQLFEALEALLADARELLVSATSCAGREDLNADDLEERGFAPDSFAKARAALAKAKGEGA